MPYLLIRPGRIFFSGIAILFLTVSANAAIPRRDSLYSPPSNTRDRPENTLYTVRDTALMVRHSGIVRHESNGDIVIHLPEGAMGRYKVRFFDEKERLLFEIRQIRDPLLIIEKYNFGHAGSFRYELYRDNSLVEKNSFRINP